MTNFSNLLLIVTNSFTFLEQAKRLFEKTTFFPVTINSCSFMDVFRQSEDETPAIFLIDLSEPSETAYSVVQKISSYFTTSRVVCAGHPSDGTLVIKLLKVGVKDFLNYPFQEEEVRLFIKQISSSSELAVTKKISETSKIITLHSPKGGSGVTLITTNLAVSLARNPKMRVVVCDLSPQCGDVATYLNLTPQYTLRDVIDNTSLLDISFLEGIMVTHSSGVKILAAPRENQDPPNSDHLNTLKSILALLKQAYDVVLIDGSHLEPTLLQFAMSQSDMIFLVGNPDVVSLKGLIAFFNKLKTLHYDTKKIKVLINRHNSKNKIDAKEFENMTKHSITSNLPNNYMLCIEAVNSGQPLSAINERSDLAKKIDELADIINQSADAGVPETKKGFLRCF